MGVEFLKGGMSIVSWNICDLGSREKRRVVKEFFRHEFARIVMFQEMKQETCDKRFVGSVWTARNTEWATFLACWAPGCVLTIWDSSKYNCS